MLHIVLYNYYNMLIYVFIVDIVQSIQLLETVTQYRYIWQYRTVQSDNIILLIYVS